jgi:hypothetical protein
MNTVADFSMKSQYDKNNFSILYLISSAYILSSSSVY